MRKYAVLLTPMFVSLLVGILEPEFGHGAQVRFTAQELENQRANWSPQEIVFSKEKDLPGPLVFVLDNPTARTHVFEAPGLFEQTRRDTGELLVKPLRITVAPEERVVVEVTVSESEGDADSCRAGETCYRFYCPLHRADDDQGGMIRLIP